MRCRRIFLTTAARVIAEQQSTKSILINAWLSCSCRDGLGTNFCFVLFFKGGQSGLRFLQDYSTGGTFQRSQRFLRQPRRCFHTSAKPAKCRAGLHCSRAGIHALGLCFRHWCSYSRLQATHQFYELLDAFIWGVKERLVWREGRELVHLSGDALTTNWYKKAALIHSWRKDR